MFVANQLNPETKKPDKERSERRDALQWTRRRKARQNFRGPRLSSHFSVDEKNCVCDTQSCRDASVSAMNWQEESDRKFSLTYCFP
jgi:hypothetical protein